MASASSFILAALGVSSLAGAEGKLVGSLPSLSHAHSSGHTALSSPSHRGNKWLVFPEQRETHLKYSVKDDLVVKSDHEKIVKTETFFTDHADALGVHHTAEFSKFHEFKGAERGVSHLKYKQKVHGIPVFGGDFDVRVGAHNGVLSAHGFPLKLLSVDDHQLAHAQVIQEQGVDDSMLNRILVIAHEHILLKTVKSREKYEMGPFSADSAEIVWLRNGPTTSQGTSAALAYHVTAIAHSPVRRGFEVFVDISSMKVLQFYETSGKASPFSSPIETPIEVHDLYLKDYNDDVDDYENDNYIDPDRGTEATKVFDTTSGSYSYPTSDDEINLLVDYTIHVSNLYNSLSNGAMAKWDDSLPFYIEYNLTVANAFFDGEWGIHFGTGFITDDVISHEWGHSFTQRMADLIYMGESGAMNEAFSDIFGEGIDLLVAEPNVQEDEHRSVWPLSCQTQVGVDGVSPAGTDNGFRWALGENVTASGFEGQLRDMYYPECHFDPGSVYSYYYACTEYPYDGSGVHTNSGVLNRLFATLTDGGEYADPSGGSNLVVEGLGLTKSLNLFYQAELMLTPYSQFIDAAVALQLACTDMIGGDIYYPNVLNDTVIVSNQKITESDCDSVYVALTGSGMLSTENHCPNLKCLFDTYYCEFDVCDSSDYVANEVDNFNTYFDPPCDDSKSKYARVFDWWDFSTWSSFEVGCIDFGYVSEGDLDVTVELFIDNDGGDPDSSMTLLGTYEVTVQNTAFNQYSVMSIDVSPVKISLSGAQTFVVVMTHEAVPSPRRFLPAGNYHYSSGTDRTFVGGGCLTDYEDYYTYCTNDGSTFCYDSWYVRLSASTSEGDDDGVCFHVDSKIDYKGVEYSYDELKAGKESECTVPHSPNSRGVVISTSCGKTLRLTDTHLVATSHGFQLAYSLKAGDLLFGDYTGAEICTVESVEKEKYVQKYFGLNCIHGEVLASGIRVSTFGDFHTLPSWYITYVGGLVGTENAALLGEYIAEWYFKH